MDVGIDVTKIRIMSIDKISKIQANFQAPEDLPMSHFTPTPTQRPHPLLISASSHACITNGSPIVTSESLLLAILLTTPASSTLEYLHKIKFPVTEILVATRSLDWVPASPATMSLPPFSPTVLEIANMAAKIAELKRMSTYTEDFLAALLLHPRSIARHVIESHVAGGFIAEFITACSLDKVRETKPHARSCIFLTRRAAPEQTTFHDQIPSRHMDVINSLDVRII